MPRPSKLREYMIDRLAGKTYKQIANVDTVRKNFSRWRRSRGLNNDVQLLAWAIAEGLVTVKDLIEAVKK